MVNNKLQSDRSVRGDTANVMEESEQTSKSHWKDRNYKQGDSNEDTDSSLFGEYHTI